MWPCSLLGLQVRLFRFRSAFFAFCRGRGFLGRAAALGVPTPAPLSKSYVIDVYPLLGVRHTPSFHLPFSFVSPSRRPPPSFQRFRKKDAAASRRPRSMFAPAKNNYCKARRLSNVFTKMRPNSTVFFNVFRKRRWGVNLYPLIGVQHANVGGFSTSALHAWRRVVFC